MGAHERHHAASTPDFPGPHIHVRAFADAASSARCAHPLTHHEFREAVPGVQATSKVGIVIGIARFGTVPDAMIEIVPQFVTGLALNGCDDAGVSARQALR